MSAKKLKVKQEEKSVAMDYLKKAEDNYIQMLSALENNNYNAVATLAIQSAISSADAICVHEKGIRSLSPDHYSCLICRIPPPVHITNFIVIRQKVWRLDHKIVLCKLHKRTHHNLARKHGWCAKLCLSLFFPARRKQYGGGKRTVKSSFRSLPKRYKDSIINLSTSMRLIYMNNKLQYLQCKAILV